MTGSMMSKVIPTSTIQQCVITPYCSCFSPSYWERWNGWSTDSIWCNHFHRSGHSISICHSSKHQSVLHTITETEVRIFRTSDAGTAGLGESTLSVNRTQTIIRYGPIVTVIFITTKVL